MSFVTKTIVVFSELLKHQPNLFALDSLKAFRADYAALPKLEDVEESQEAIADFICEWVEQHPAIKQVFMQSLAATPQERNAKGLRDLEEASVEEDTDFYELLLELADILIQKLEPQPVPVEQIIANSEN